MTDSSNQSNDPRFSFTRVERITGIAIPPEEQTEAVRRALDALMEIIERDPLTSFMSRRSFNGHLIDLMNSVSDGHQATVIFFDLNKFKSVNTILGQEGGNQLIAMVAEFIKQNLRMRQPQDSVTHDRRPKGHSLLDIGGRHGGDEFMVLVQYCGEALAKSVMDRVSEKLKRHEFSIGDTRVRDLTLTYGCVDLSAISWDQEIATDPQQAENWIRGLMEMADTAVKEHKVDSSREATYIRGDEIIWSEELRQRGEPMPHFVRPRETWAHNGGRRSGDPELRIP